MPKRRDFIIATTRIARMKIRNRDSLVAMVANRIILVRLLPDLTLDAYFGSSYCDNNSSNQPPIRSRISKERCKAPSDPKPSRFGWN